MWLSDFHLDVEGIGFVPTKEDPYCFLDLDNCIDLNANWCADWVVTLIEELKILYYLTPSRKGIRVVLRGELVNGGGFYVYQDDDGDHLLEAYDCNHFMTITHWMSDYPIREAQDFLDNLRKHRGDQLKIVDTSRRGAEHLDAAATVWWDRRRLIRSPQSACFVALEQP